MSFHWSENFAYPAGVLAGQGPWAESLPRAPAYVDASGAVGGDETGALAAGVLAGLNWFAPFRITLVGRVPFTEDVAQNIEVTFGGGLNVGFGTKGFDSARVWVYMVGPDWASSVNGPEVTEWLLVDSGSPMTMVLTGDGKMVTCSLNGQTVGSVRLSPDLTSDVALHFQIIDAVAHLGSILVAQQDPTLYITQADLEAVIPEDQFLQLFDRDQDGVADGALVAVAIGGAVAKVHGYLAKRHLLPLDSSDELLMAFLKPGLVDLAWAQGHPRADMVNGKLQTRIDTFLARLADVRDGKADLPATNAVASGPGGGGGPAVMHSAQPRKTKGGMP